MQDQTIKTLNEKLVNAESNVTEIETALQGAWDAVFEKSKVITNAISKLELSNDFAFDKYGEISSYIRFYDLKDFQECRQYLETYMLETHSVGVDWDTDCLTYSYGSDNIVIQDDTRHDNGVWAGHKLVIKESEYTDLVGPRGTEVNETKRNQLIEAYMEKSGYFPGVFRVSSYGDISLVNTKV